MGVADRDRQRVGGVRARRRRSRAAGGAPSSRPAPCRHGRRRPPISSPGWRSIRRPAAARSAGASSTTPRAWPSFRVEAGFLLTKVSSTAASSGRIALDHRDEPVDTAATSRSASGRSVGGMDDAVGDMAQPVALDVDDAPAGVPQPGIEPENPHRVVAPMPSAVPSPVQALNRASTSSAISKLAVDVLHVVVVLERLDQLEQVSARSRRRPARWSSAARSSRAELAAGRSASPARRAPR